MGLAFSFNPEDHEAWLNVGGPGFGLIECKDVPKTEFCNINEEVQPLIQFEVEDIHGAYQALIAQGIEVSEMRYRPTAGSNFNLRDPDGHVINFWSGWSSSE